MNFNLIQQFIFNKWQFKKLNNHTEKSKLNKMHDPLTKVEVKLLFQ